VPQALLNFGGIGNLTLLSGDGSVTGFDCGPGNALLDLWCERHLGQAFDDDGRWAAGGRADEDLLAMMLAEPFFKRPPPKSTGRDLFHADWLDSAISRCAHGSTISSRDVMATLAELTVRSAVVALRDHLPECRRLLVCGGGASNGYLMSRLHALLSPMPVQSTLIEGLPPQQVEATAFAWLARAFTNRQPASRPAVTGARGPRILGALYLAS
jgi:anhydro-N-acetylmuramic acid kinase